jgi:hypothetical protein
MKMYNLTEEQKLSLRWIIQKIRNEELGEVFDCVFFATGKCARFQGKGENITEEIPLSEGILQSLQASDMIFIEKREKAVWRCGLLGNKAYKAVDSNFAETKTVSLSEREMIFKIIIAIILLGSAFAGFMWLPPTGAVLWLVFLIVAYPVALAFTTAQQSMDNHNLVEIYKAGVNQIPVLIRFVWNKLFP